MKPEEKWNNTVIEVLTKEHGKKVIEWWKEQGVDAKGCEGTISRECRGFTTYYYGLIDGMFSNWNIESVKFNNAKIITIPEPFPEQWYLICDEENQEVVNEWRNEKADLCYKDKTVDIGWYFLSQCPYDKSYYSCGNVLNDYRFKGYCPITFEQFKEHVLKQPKQSNKMKITSEQAQKIIDMVSPSCKWKERLLDLWAKSIVLKQEIDVSDELYKEGYKDASESQKKVLDGIFGKSKGVDITERPVNYFLIPRTDGDYKDKSFYLTNNYNWEIKKDNEGELCLIPTNK